MNPIVMSFDIKYMNQLIVALWSLIKNNSSDEILNVIVLHGKDVTENVKDYIKNRYKGNSKLSLTFIEIDGKLFVDAQSSGHIGLPAYYRLIIPDILTFDKCLYIDSDLVVNDDITQLLNIDLGDSYFAGCLDFGFIIDPDYAMVHKNKYYFETVRNYINTGVICLNLKKLREDAIPKKLMDDVGYGYPFCDQDIINKTCGSKIVHFNKSYNHFNKFSDYSYWWDENYDFKKKIIHYAGPYKPWDFVRSRYADIWWKYAAEILEKEEYERLYNNAVEFSKVTDWDYLCNKCKNEKELVIVGFSRISMNLIKDLKRCGIQSGFYVCDNSEEKRNLSADSLIIYDVEHLSRKVPDALWIISSQNYRNEINSQLIDLGIESNRITYYYEKKDSYYEMIDEKYLDYEMKQYYFRKTGEKME